MQVFNLDADVGRVHTLQLEPGECVADRTGQPLVRNRLPVRQRSPLRLAVVDSESVVFCEEVIADELTLVRNSDLTCEATVQQLNRHLDVIDSPSDRRGNPVCIYLFGTVTLLVATAGSQLLHRQCDR